MGWRRRPLGTARTGGPKNNTCAILIRLSRGTDRLCRWGASRGALPMRVLKSPHIQVSCPHAHGLDGHQAFTGRSPRGRRRAQSPHRDAEGRTCQARRRCGWSLGGLRARAESGGPWRHGRLCASSRFCSSGVILNSSIACLMAVSSSGASTWPRSFAGVPICSGRTNRARPQTVDRFVMHALSGRPAACPIVGHWATTSCRGMRLLDAEHEQSVSSCRSPRTLRRAQLRGEIQRQPSKPPGPQSIR
jgi:hypothetical protein